MAVSANTVWELRATAAANMVNGGGFVTGATGVDYSKQDAAQYALTGVTSAGAGNVILSASAATDMVGNIIHTVSGTNFTNSSWFEITAVSAGVSITCSTNAAGTAISTGVGATGVMNVGGSLSLNSTLDDDFFESVIGGNTIWVKNGSYTLGEAVAVASTSGSLTTPIIMKGYNSTRGDNPTGSTRPTIACGANGFALGQYYFTYYLITTHTDAAGLTAGTGGVFLFCKATNTSTTTTRVAITHGNTGAVLNCEAVSQNGTGISTVNTGGHVNGCYVHDSPTGISATGATPSITRNIVEGCSTQALALTSGTGAGFIQNNTFYGSEAKVGTGVAISASVPSNIFFNNIFYGLTTGISQATLQRASNFGSNNCFFNNTANSALYTLDVTDITTTPAFTAASQITGTTATTSASTLTQSGGDFSTVTDNQDYLRVVSGTGVTTGIYLITSHATTTLTVNNALGTSSGGDVVYSVGVGHNFVAGSNVRGAGIPSTFPGGLTVGALDIGGVQNQVSSRWYAGE